MWADVTPYSNDYEDATPNVDWVSGNTGRYTVGIEGTTDHYLHVGAVGNGNNGATITCSATNGKVTAGTDLYMSFDLVLDGANTSGQHSTFYIFDKNNSTSTPILKIYQNDGGTYTGWTVNDNTALTTGGKGTGNWYNYVLTRIGTKEYLTVTKKSNSSKVLDMVEITNLSNDGGLGNMQFATAKYYAGMYIDNVVVRALDAPAFTLSTTEVTPEVSGNATVNVTGINGTVSVSSDNTSVATASYDNGEITINGVANGVANITVTAINDGAKTTQTITATVGAVAKTNITVNYLCGGSPIASATTIENVNVGSTLTLSDITYSETIAGVGCRYANPTFSVSFPYTVVEDGVIDITYTQQNAVSTLNIYGSVAGNNYLLHTYALDGKYVGDAVLVTYPEYYLLDGTIYSTASKQFSGSDFYSGSFTLTGTDPVLTYNSVESNVVYFSEAENIVGGTENASSNANIRCSDAKGAYFESATNVVTLPAGKYTIHSQVWGGHNTDDSKNVDFTFNDGTSDFYVHRTTGALNPKSQEFTLTSTATITVTGGSSGKVLDMVYIVKTGEVATIGSTGYTTFASSYPLNIDGMTANTGTVKAYYVTASDVKNSSVALTEVTGNVPAGTGLILEGTAGATITIPVVAAGTALSGNKLVGCTTATDITSATENYDNFYVLSATEAAFKKIKTWVDTPHTLTIPAGKAYLDTTGAGVVGAPTLNFDLSGEATGIADVRGKMEDVRSDFFDLQGRKVAQPAKGLYIVNGKKVVIK